MSDPLSIDEKTFFIETTLRICGSLEIETALHRCLRYIHRFIPADLALLTYYDTDRYTVNGMAVSTLEKGQRSVMSVDIPTETGAIFQKATESEVYWTNDPVHHPILRHFLHISGENASVMVMRLVLEKKFVGAFVLRVKGKGRYTKEHARLLGMLNDPVAIALTNSLRHQEIVALKDLLADDNRYLQDELRRGAGEVVVGADFGLKGVMEQVRQVAPLDSPVLLLGETGVGKEMVANAIHNTSARRDNPFVKINCGAIPEALIDSELFGHEKGAFTGAMSQKRGRFERAGSGTIFLDEIGELPPEAQVRLLRVLQEKEIERVGGGRSIRVDIRVIAATHRDLGAMMGDGRFREDLYFRINVFPIEIPPLRARKADIPALVQHFLQKKVQEIGLSGRPSLSGEAMDQLLAYHWPGNVRELENTIERALITHKHKPLTFNHLRMASPQDLSVRPEPISLTMQDGPSVLNLDELFSAHIRHVLEITGGRIQGVKGAARLLGVQPNTLRARMKKLGIPFGRKAKSL